MENLVKTSDVVAAALAYAYQVSRGKSKTDSMEWGVRAGLYSAASRQIGARSSIAETSVLPEEVTITMLSALAYEVLAKQKALGAPVAMDVVTFGAIEWLADVATPMVLGEDKTLV